MDMNDDDLGSGGVLVLPPLNGNYLAVAAGKDGRLFLLKTRPPTGDLTKISTNYSLAPCWCGPSYFVGSDGIARVVTSHGNTFQLFTSTLLYRPQSCPSWEHRPRLVLVERRIPAFSRRFRLTAPRRGARLSGRFHVQTARTPTIRPRSSFMHSRQYPHAQARHAHTRSSIPRRQERGHS